jgi:hypothetical protein
MTVPRWKFGEELERVESGVDFGGLVGNFVRLSEQRDDGGTEWVNLTPDEADTLAVPLRDAAELPRKRIQEDRRRRSQGDAARTGRRLSPATMRRCSP